ncbi:MAG: GNAT family N-acetyltransferase [Bacteroidota bacterium]|jgi:phosphinothricin acetyltransferase
MQASHYEEVSVIFKQGIESGNATYETQSPSWQEWDKGHLPQVRFVALDQGQVIGWIALSPVSNRFVFRGVAELSIYIHDNFQGRGVGAQLMEAAIESSVAEGIWMLQSGIFPENVGSIALHKKFGFREVGYRERIGQMPKSGEWRDIVLLERRMKV